jgi:hypothetical protein
MKMTSEHYAYLKRAISCHLENRDAPSKEVQYRTEGLTPRRFRSDCLYGAKLSTWVCDNLYGYLNDDHIDTAMRAIMRELHLDWATKAS